MIILLRFSMWAVAYFVDHVSTGNLIDRAFVVVLCSAWLVWYHWASCCCLLMLFDGKEGISPGHKAGCFLVEKGCGRVLLQVSSNFLASLGRWKEFWACVDKTSWTMTLTMTKSLSLVLPTHPGKGESPTHWVNRLPPWCILVSPPGSIHQH